MVPQEPSIASRSQVGRGEIVGLLGPNGAGKTTTMRMLTTLSRSPRAAAPSLAGHDVLDEPLEVRRKVGYLPENVPLYPEMRVREYLAFRAKLKDVPRSRRREAIEDVIQAVQARARSRTGSSASSPRDTASASAWPRRWCTIPDILILDEPTAGLDPIQVREVRALIRELGDQHTILLSTHIMPEVEAVCGRVIIIAQGRIAVDEHARSPPVGSVDPDRGARGRPSDPPAIRIGARGRARRTWRHGRRARFVRGQAHGAAGSSRGARRSGSSRTAGRSAARHRPQSHWKTDSSRPSPARP